VIEHNKQIFASEAAAKQRNRAELYIITYLLGPSVFSPSHRFVEQYLVQENIMLRSHAATFILWKNLKSRYGRDRKAIRSMMWNSNEISLSSCSNFLRSLALASLGI
jgi:hypothetical protein